MRKHMKERIGGHNEKQIMQCDNDSRKAWSKSVKKVQN